MTLNVDEIQMKFPYSKSLQNFGSLDVCRVTLSFVSAAGKLRNMPGHAAGVSPTTFAMQGLRQIK